MIKIPRSLVGGCISIFLSFNTAIAQNNIINSRNDYALAIESWTGDFDEILNRRLIRILVPFNKTYYYIDKGNEYGIAVDLGHELERWMNNRHKNTSIPFRVIFVPKPHDQLISSLIKGEGDLIGSPYAISDNRQKIMDFTYPWINNSKVILVSNTNTQPIINMDQLSGKEIAVQKSSIFVDELEKINTSFIEKNMNPIKIFYIDQNMELEDILESINAGLLTYTVSNQEIAKLWSRVFPNLKINTEFFISNNENAAWAMRKNSPLLKQELDQFVKSHAVGTGFGNQVITKYLDSSKFIKNSLEENEISKFTQLVDLFKIYGKKYDFDYLMLAAMGYQESGLDQNKKSNHGAVGVMQIMPNIAASKPIEIMNVQNDVDANIRAGVLYLNYLKKTYLNDVQVDDMNKMLFTMAAYNAGPNNLREFRQITQAQGLNPNKWFNNVEYGAARKVGRETVQYVSNIYKYYLAYKLIMHHQQDLMNARDGLKNKN